METSQHSSTAFLLKPLGLQDVQLVNLKIMEEELNSAFPEEIKKAEVANSELDELLDKVNVDQAAIDEAREAVGDDEAKIKEYLINNRGL